MRIKTEYDAAKRDYDEAPKVSQAVLDTLGRVESMQAQEVRLLLGDAFGMISQRACGLINQTITMTLADGGMSLGGMDVGHSTRVASNGVSVVQYPGCATGTDQVTRSFRPAVFSQGTEILVATYKDPFLRKPE